MRHLKASELSLYTSEMPTDIPWCIIKDITNDFSEERQIGRGGYGAVYKGVHEDGHVVAVKKLYHMPGLDAMQFQSEIRNLVGLHHPNIVHLVGKSYLEQERCVEYDGKLVVATMIDRAICLEYVPNGSLEKHLYDEFSGFSWPTRYKIIKGICNGLEYLHQRRIYHLDLKPANILLDRDMLPKIADFGLSRIFSGSRQSHTTHKFMGTIGYVPPEFIEEGKISEKFDVFSLGVIIKKIFTGPDVDGRRSDLSSEEFIELAHENWRKRLEMDGLKDASYLDALCQQVKTCIEMALNCVQTDRHKRPSIQDIIRGLDGTETTLDEMSKQLFVLQPQSLCFPFEPDKLIPCPLHITNNMDQGITLRIRPMTPNLFVRSTLRGYVPAKSTHTHTLIMEKQQKPMLLNPDSIVIQSYVGRYVGGYVGDSLVDHMLPIHRDEIKEVRLSSFQDNENQVTLEFCGVSILMRQPIHIQPRIKVLPIYYTAKVDDMHPTEPWILTCGHRHLQILNYRTEAQLNLSKLLLTLEEHEDGISCNVAKFIARKQWLVTGDEAGYMHVCCYKTMQRLKRFKAHHQPVRELAVHPTEPYVLSASPGEGTVSLWNWEKEWECTRTFLFEVVGLDHAYVPRFNPNDKNTFAVCGRTGIKICYLVPPGSTFIQDEYEYEDENVFCFDYCAHGGHQYLIMGCSRGTVQIWDMQTKSPVKKIKHGDPVNCDGITAFCYCQEHSILVTGSLNGTVCLWNLATFSPERTFSFGTGGVHCVQLHTEGSRRTIVVRHNHGLVMIQVDHTDKAVSYSGSSQEDCLIRSNKRKSLEHDRHEIENQD